MDWKILFVENEGIIVAVALTMACLFYIEGWKYYSHWMKLIWCTKKGVAHGFQNELVACVACVCKKRKTCKAYAETPLQDIAAANRESKQHGHNVAENLPLFEAVLKD